MKPKQERDNELSDMIEEENKNKLKQLEVGQTQLRVALDDDRKKLGAPINWEQATKDNEAMEHVIKQQRDSATKDWKVEYRKLVEQKWCVSFKGSEGGI